MKLRRLRDDESGQSLVVVLVMTVVLIAFAGLAIDLGRVWIARQQLQQAVDAAALAAGQDLPDSASAYTAATNYAATDQNPVTGWGVKAGNPSVTFECVNAGGYVASNSLPSCQTDTSQTGGTSNNCKPPGDSNSPLPSGATTCNAVNVTESATVTSSLLKLFIPNFTVTASSTASAPTGVPIPLNVYVIIDTTGSMDTDTCDATITDNNGNTVTAPRDGFTNLDCAKAGMRALLGVLDPCATTLSTCGGDLTGTTNVQYPADEVGELVFPAISETLSGSGTVGSPYALAAPSSTTLGYETDCISSDDSFGVTYPPYQRYTYNSTATDGGIPLSTPGANAPGSSSDKITDDPTGDNYVGYQALPLASDYRSSDTAASLNTSSSLVKSVYWAQCTNGNYPGGNYYGLKSPNGQGSYLAGAITEAQYLLTTQAPQTRTLPNGKTETATNAIIVLSDGELNEPDTGNDNSDGVDPSPANENHTQTNGDQTWTSTTQCEDALDAATAAKAAKTLVFSIAYNDSGGQCTDTGSGGYSGSAETLMKDISSGAKYFATASGDLTSAFVDAGESISAQSRLVDCTQAAPSC